MTERGFYDKYEIEMMTASGTYQVVGLKWEQPNCFFCRKEITRVILSEGHLTLAGAERAMRLYVDERSVASRREYDRHGNFEPLTW